MHNVCAMRVYREVFYIRVMLRVPASQGITVISVCTSVFITQMKFSGFYKRVLRSMTLFINMSRTLIFLGRAV